MGAAARGRDQVHVGLSYRVDTGLVGRDPGQRPVDGLVGLGFTALERGADDGVDALERIGHVIRQAVGVLPDDILFGGFIDKAHFEIRAEHSLGTQQMLQARGGDTGAVEIRIVRPEMQHRAGFRLGTGAQLDQFACLVAVFKTHLVVCATAPHLNDELGGQRVDHGHAHTVQPAGILIVLRRELAPGMQAREDQLDPGDAVLAMGVHGHAAPIIDHRQAAVGVERDFDGFGVAGQCLVHAVIDDLLGQMVRARGLGEHTRSLSNRIQPGEHFDIGGIVLIGHSKSQTGVMAGQGKPGTDRWQEMVRLAQGCCRFIRAPLSSRVHSVSCKTRVAARAVPRSRLASATPPIFNCLWAAQPFGTSVPKLTTRRQYSVPAH